MAHLDREATIPTSVLASLVASIDNLREDVAQLKKDNASLSMELAHFRSSGSRFTKFQKLPVELRNTIWDMALEGPQIHIVSEEAVSRSDINNVMAACKESRTRGLAFHFPFLQTGANGSGIPRPYAKQYMNMKADTIWMVDLPREPDDLQVFCECYHSPLSIIPWLDIKDTFENHRLNAIAMSFEVWQDPDQLRGLAYSPDPNTGTTDLIRRTRPRVLYIVVGGTEACKDRNVKFIKPRKLPYEMLYGQFDFGNNLPLGLELQMTSIDMEFSWDCMAIRLQLILRHFKKTRARLRRREMEGLTIYLLG
ncbi:hypothetical protein BGZ60DRAFT_397369 [Tricladium varicosporioides]|nr:hypothetical protein BGZ60DRAFT_397369 [Hymenoscyphus varicosporioides]